MTNGIPWTPEEDSRLLYLVEVRKLSFANASRHLPRLGFPKRTPNSIVGHYHRLHGAKEARNYTKGPVLVVDNSGEVTCLTCQKSFHSPDNRRVRICRRCKPLVASLQSSMAV